MESKENLNIEGTMPIVSVVTVVYNDFLHIEHTIKSVLNQTYSNIEYIIIDGGSTDGTNEVIKKYENKISKWISERDNGIYDAMNKAIELATGEWVIFMNSGDSFYNSRVIKESLNESYPLNTAIIYGDVELDFGNNKKLVKSFGRIPENKVATELCHQSVITKTSVLKKIKFDTSYKIMADLKSFNQIYLLGYKLKYTSTIMASYEITSGVSSTKPFLSFNETCRLKSIKKYSLSYFIQLARAVRTYMMLNLCPKYIYDYIRYCKIKSIKKYKK